MIHGPATSNYDEDLGILVITDWSHETAVQMYPGVLAITFSIQDNGLINGTNTWQDQGKRWEVAFQPGKKYLMRIVNVSVDHHFKFSIDGHTLTVIAADFVPIKPYTTQILNVGIGKLSFVRLTMFGSHANDSLHSATLRCDCECRCTPR